MILNAIIQKDENGYFAFVPELSGCVTQADSYEEAISNIKEAAALYMESLQLDEIRHIQAKGKLSHRTSQCLSYQNLQQKVKSFCFRRLSYCKTKG